jgi:catechol 2,3-dioxygenase-like lactoylglutathione lyase family enzyme|tara:strand:+ start:379 stop:762 length:384 start_codon:yes stop_codon:yes gene_type:complete
MNITRITPQIRTTNLERAISFYTELGFGLDFRYEDFYAGISIGTRGLHLKLVDDADPSIDFVRDGGHLHLHFTVEDIQSTFDEINTKATIVENICNRPWGLTEFVIEDPDGHTLYFSQPTPKDSERN